MPTIQISSRAYDLLPDGGSSDYLEARKRLGKKRWGRGYSYQGYVTPQGHRAFSKEAKDTHAKLTGNDRQALQVALKRLGVAFLVLLMTAPVFGAGERRRFGPRDNSVIGTQSQPIFCGIDLVTGTPIGVPVGGAVAKKYAKRQAEIVGRCWDIWVRDGHLVGMDEIRAANCPSAEMLVGLPQACPDDEAVADPGPVQESLVGDVMLSSVGPLIRGWIEAAVDAACDARERPDTGGDLADALLDRMDDR